MRIVGPNCLGIMNPLIQYNATFAATMARTGSIAFISQSGAMCTAVLDWSLKQKVGFSAFVSIGSMADVNWGDLIDYLGSDPNTNSILIYMETIGNAKAFLSAARAVVLSKPIIVIKAGRTEAAAKAAASHTGSLAGSDEVFDAAMRRAGVLRVDTIGELFDVAEVLAKQPAPTGPNLAILTNAGGPAVLATDAVSASGGELAPLDPKTIEQLSTFLPAAWSHGNPIDLLGDASPERYAKALEVVAKDPTVDGILTILSPQDMTDVSGTAECLIPYARTFDKPLLASWMGGEVVAKGAKLLRENHIPTFEFPDDASRTFASMYHQYHALQALYETPALRSQQDLGKARDMAQTLIQRVENEGRTLLTELESKQLLAAYSIPIVDMVRTQDAKEAGAAAEKMGFPVVLKLHSETITHKTDVGGVLLNLATKEEVESGYVIIEKNCAEKAGKEHFHGVSVQKMITFKGYELILGSTVDVQFGPVILFGTGGQLVEIFKYRALGLPPLNSVLANRLMARTKIYEALQGVRGRAPIDMDKLEEMLIAFSNLVVENPRISECDINPLLVSDEGMVALDARIVLHEKELADSDLPKPVIRPYPHQYISTTKLKNGKELLIRPIRPEDEPLLIPFHEELSEKTVKARYFEKMSFKERTAHTRLRCITHTDYEREITLVAEDQGAIIGVGRLTKAENGGQVHLIVIDRVQRQGVGATLLEKMVEVGRAEGLEELTAQTLSDNEAMQALLKKTGFSLNPSEKNPQIVNATIRLDTKSKK
jgi:acetyltransferase